MQQVNIVQSLNFNQMNGGMWTCASADYNIYHFNLLGPVCYHYRPYKLLYEIYIFLSCSQSFT